MNINFIYLAVSAQAIARLLVRDHIKRRIRMVRENKNAAHVQSPSDPNFISTPIPLTKTVHDDKFLRCDTRPRMFL